MTLSTFTRLHLAFWAAGAAWAGDGPVELGRVDWLRDHDQAFQEARRTARPVLLLFQEIPG